MVSFKTDLLFLVLIYLSLVVLWLCVVHSCAEAPLPPPAHAREASYRQQEKLWKYLQGRHFPTT